MATPPYVPVAPGQEPLRGDLQHFPPPRRPAVRPAEITGPQPRGPGLGTRTPDAGYALLLARRLVDRVQLAERERLDDALWAGAIIGMKRAGLVGRGPLLADVELGLAILGYLGGAPDDMVAWRQHHLFGLDRNYHLQRAVADRVGADLLSRAPSDPPSLLRLEDDLRRPAGRAAAVVDAAGGAVRGRRTAGTAAGYVTAATSAGGDTAGGTHEDPAPPRLPVPPQEGSHHDTGGHMNAAPSHPQLLTRANKVRAAAADHDLERLQREVSLLLDAFVDHTDEESAHLLELPTFTARLVRRGQERLLDRLITLSVEAEEVDEPCRCEQLGADVAVQLTLQADAERRAFARAGITVDAPPRG